MGLGLLGLASGNPTSNQPGWKSAQPQSTGPQSANRGFHQTDINETAIQPTRLSINPAFINLPAFRSILPFAESPLHPRTFLRYCSLPLLEPIGTY